MARPVQPQEHFSTAAKLVQADPKTRKSFAVSNSCTCTNMASDLFVSLIQLGSTGTCFHSYTSMIYDCNDKPSVILKLIGLGKSLGLVETELVIALETLL